MFDGVRARISATLAAQAVGVLSVRAGRGVIAMPVRYCSHGVEVDCLLPRYSDTGFYAQEHRQVCLVVLLKSGWLQYQGTVQPGGEPDWPCLLPEGRPGPDPGALYLVLRLAPVRVEIAGAGWGDRETFDFQ